MFGISTGSGTGGLCTCRMWFRKFFNRHQSIRDKSGGNKSRRGYGRCRGKRDI